MEKHPFKTLPYYIFFVPFIIPTVLIIEFFQGKLDSLDLWSIIPGLVLIGIFGYSFWETNRKNIIITALRNRGEYRNVIIQTLDERTTGGRRSRTYYVYVCRDPITDKTYDSDEIDIENSTFKIGDIVYAYISSEFPDIYWIDLNYVESGSGKNKLSQEEQVIGEKMVNTMKKKAKKDKSSNKWFNFMLFGFGTIVCLCYSAYNLFFYMASTETIGTITQIVPYNSYCKKRHDCTKYTTTIYLDKIEFLAPFYIKIDTQTVNGHNQPISHSKYQVGQGIELIVNPSEVYSQDGTHNGVEIKKVVLNRIWIYSIISSIFLFFSILFLTAKSGKKNSYINLQNTN